MPSHLHPRSRATSALFAGTLFACFAVVAVPHIWPCPRPRISHNDVEIIYDGDGKPIKRIRRVRRVQSEDGSVTEQNVQGTRASLGSKKLDDDAELLRQLSNEAVMMEQKNARTECPIPKPGGSIGRLLGFQTSEKR